MTTQSLCHVPTKASFPSDLWFSGCWSTTSGYPLIGVWRTIAAGWQFDV